MGAVKKTHKSSESLAFESIEDVGRQLLEEEELLKVRMVREAVASRSAKKKATNKRRKTEKKTRSLKSRQKDRKEVRKNKKGKIGSFSRKKTVKGGKNKNRKQKSRARK